MTTRDQLVTRLQTYLRDTAPLRYTAADLAEWIRLGNEALYPRVYVETTDTSLAGIANTVEYALPASVPRGVGFSALREVQELPATVGASAPIRLHGWRVDEGAGLLVFEGDEIPTTGRTLRLRSMGRLRALDAGATVFEGTAQAEEAVLVWAMARALGTDRRGALREAGRLQGAQGIRAASQEDFEYVLRPGGGVYMPALPLRR